MLIRRLKSDLPSLMTPLRVCLLAGATVVTLTAVAVNVWLSPVQAKVLLPRPTSTLPPAIPSLKTLQAEQTAATKQSTSQKLQQKKSLLRGLASWYGDAFDGQKMANGEIFDMHAMTACHPTLPFGTWVKVKNLRNGKSVIVRITDRGALAAGRILDLSYGAAQKLAMTNAGLAPVVLEVISQQKAKEAQTEATKSAN